MNNKGRLLKFGLATSIFAGIMVSPLIVTSCKSNDANTNQEDFVNGKNDLMEAMNNVKITANELAKEKTAYGWTVKDITSKYFDNLPTNGKGILVKILSVDNYPNDQKIDITIQFSTIISDGVSVITETRVYEVNGFRKETIDERVDRIYGDLNITPTVKGIQIPAIEENWSLKDINEENFKGLPEDQEGISVELVGLGFDDSDFLQGKIILTYKFSIYDGLHSVTRDFVVSGFEKVSYNSNVAAQNHYKLVALYRIVDVKGGVDLSKVNTDEIEEGGMKKVKEVFELPKDRQYNTVSLVDVISSSDNTLETFQKGQNMELGSVKLKFSIYDYVNNNTSYVETAVFTGFENPLNYWDELFKENVVLRTPLSDSLFSYNKFYDTARKYSTTTYDDVTESNVLNGTNTGTGQNRDLKSYLLPLVDWVGYKKSSYNPMYGHGESYFGLKNMSPDHERFVNMITYDAENNYLGSGPDKTNDIVTPIKNGGVSETLRRYLFDNIKNQELYKYDWIVYKDFVNPKYADQQLSWAGHNIEGIPFGYHSVWVNTTFEYDVWLDYTKTTIKFNVLLGMVDKARNQGSDNGWIKT